MIYRKPYTGSHNGLSRYTLKRKFSPVVGRLENISSIAKNCRQIESVNVT